MSNFLESSYVLYTMSNNQYQQFPAFFYSLSNQFYTPIRAMLLQYLIIAILMKYFDFQSLIILDSFFNSISLLLEFISYLRLKYIEKDTLRPYEVPYGLLGAYVITIPKMLIIIASFWLLKTQYITIALLCQLAIIVLYVIKNLLNLNKLIIIQFLVMMTLTLLG